MTKFWKIEEILRDKHGRPKEGKLLAFDGGADDDLLARACQG